MAHNRFDRNLERLNRDLGITNENVTIPIVASRNVNPTIEVNAAEAEVKTEKVDAAEQVEPTEQVAQTEAITETAPQETPQVQETVQEPVNTEPTTEQRNQISLLKKAGYKVPEENITMLDDGSVKITIKTKNSTNIPEIVFDNKGKIVSAKNVTGKMLTLYLFKGNSSLSQAAYKLAPGEDDEEKNANFNKGRYTIGTDNQGNLIITFIKKYEKPAEEGETSSTEDYSSLTTSDSGEILQDFNPGDSVAGQATEEVTEAPTGTYILITPDGKVSLESGVIPTEAVVETEAPAETEAQAEAEAPTATETPTVTEEPAAVETPTAAEEPETAEAEAETVAPTVTDTVEEEQPPAETETPEVAAAPTPEVTATPEATATPEVEATEEVQAPQAAETPEVTATPEATATPEVAEAEETVEEADETEELLSEDKLNSILEFVAKELNIDFNDIDNVNISEKTDTNKNQVILITFTAGGVEHTAEYYPQYDKTHRIDGEEVITYTDTGTLEAQKAMGSLKLTKDEEKSNSNTNVFNHNNVSIIISMYGTQVYNKQLQIDGETVDGTIIDNDKVEETLNSINPGLKAKIDSVVGSTGADRIIYIENEYNTWIFSHHHDIKVAALKDVEIDGVKYTNSVIYTFDQDGNITKVEYSSKGESQELVSFEKVQNMAEIMGVSTTELILGADNFENYWKNAKYERDAHEEGERPVALYYDCDSLPCGRNLKYEQAERFLQSQMENIKQFFMDRGLNINWEEAYISVYSSDDYYTAEYAEREPVEDAKYFAYSVMVEANGVKYIFGENGTQCVIINEHGAVDKKFAPYTLDEDYDY